MVAAGVKDRPSWETLFYSEVHGGCLHNVRSGVVCRAVGFVLAVTAIVMIAGLSGCRGGVAEAGTQAVEIGGERFELELALDDDARYRGLSGRESIAEDGGMLFIFPRERERTFVMRDCLVPIDILFLGGRGQVLSAHAMQVEPPGQRADPSTFYSSDGRSAAVIELKGGTIRRLGVEVGDVIALPLIQLKRRAL